MPAKPFKPVDLSSKVEKPAKANTTKVDHSSEERTSRNFGEQDTLNCSVPYGGVRRSVNVTVNAPELQRGIAKQKAEFATKIASHQEYKRVPKGERKVKHRLPLEEEYLPDGDIKLSRPTTTTRRTER